MHISEVEKARLEKEHKMRHGYHAVDAKKAHENDIHEHAYRHKDIENMHARETKPEDFDMEMGR